jgi:TRAP-type mannitol/chloroaromatic compound transport system permease small subunit
MIAVLRLFVRAVEGLNGVVGRVVAVGLLGMIALVVWEVFLRYVLNAPTTWGFELISYLFAAYILLGGGYTLLHRDHVAMDIVYASLSTRRQAILDVLTAGFVLIYCYVLMDQSWIMASESLERGQTANSDWGPPLFPVYVCIPIGAALLLLQAVAKLMRDLHFAFTGRTLLPEHESSVEEKPAL